MKIHCHRYYTLRHDVLEGVAKLELKNLLDSLIEDKLLTLDVLNLKLTQFNYGYVYRDRYAIFLDYYCLFSNDFWQYPPMKLVGLEKIEFIDSFA
jgi:hypothetical protein